MRQDKIYDATTKLKMHAAHDQIDTIARPSIAMLAMTETSANGQLCDMSRAGRIKQPKIPKTIAHIDRKGQRHCHGIVASTFERA